MPEIFWSSSLRIIRLKKSKAIMEKIFTESEITADIYSGIIDCIREFFEKTLTIYEKYVIILSEKIGILYFYRGLLKTPKM